MYNEDVHYSITYILWYRMYITVLHVYYNITCMHGLLNTRPYMSHLRGQN